MTHNDKIYVVIHYDEATVEDNCLMTYEEMEYSSEFNKFITELPSNLYNQRSKIYNFEKKYIQETDSSLYILSYIACQYYFKQ